MNDWHQSGHDTWPQALSAGKIPWVETAPPSIRDALAALRGHLAGAHFPLESDDAAHARRTRGETLAQLDDYVVPRLEHPDAPLLAVVGGSTGAGKSTLVNSLVGRPVSRAGVRRPTTRTPVLIHHPGDGEWFTQPRVLPDLERAEADDHSDGTLRVVADDGVPVGVAVLDAPDVDSVVTGNRTLATQLLAAADVWLFVTTAARYADATPWELLAEAADRRTAVAVVLDRVPADAVSEIRGHLAGLLAERGLGDAPLLVVEEVEPDESGVLPPGAVEAVRLWLDGLTTDEAARGELVRRTLDGAVDDVLRRADGLADAADRQGEVLAELQSEVADAYDEAVSRIGEAVSDGTLLHGDLLARWNDFVDTGDFARSLESRGGRVRDRLRTFLRGRPQRALDVGQAAEQALCAMLVEHADRAAEQTDQRWRRSPAGQKLLGDDDLSRVASTFAERCASVVREWHEVVVELIRTEDVEDRAGARRISAGVAGLGVALMVAVFAPPPGPRLLEQIFGEEVVRRNAAKALADLSGRIDALLATESSRFTDRLGGLMVEAGLGDTLRAAVQDVRQAREDAA